MGLASELYKAQGDIYLLHILVSSFDYCVRYNWKHASINYCRIIPYKGENIPHSLIIKVLIKSNIFEVISVSNMYTIYSLLSQGHNSFHSRWGFFVQYHLER